MSRTNTPPDTRRLIRACIQRELAGGDLTGLHLDDPGALALSHRWVSTTATPRLTGGASGSAASPGSGGPSTYVRPLQRRPTDEYRS